MFSFKTKVMRHKQINKETSANSKETARPAVPETSETPETEKKRECNPDDRDHLKKVVKTVSGSDDPASVSWP